MRYPRLPSVALLVFCGWFAAGCVDDENGLAIVHFVFLSTDTKCVADPASMTITSSDTFDVGVSTDLGGLSFLLAPVVVNNLVVNTSTTAPVNTIFLNGFDIELKPDPADPNVSAAIPTSLRKYHVPASGGAIFPGGGAVAMTTSETAVIFEALSGDLARVVQPAIPDGTRDGLALDIRLRPTGTHSGVTINGGWVDYPVFLCNHCLASALAACPAAGYPKNQVLSGCNPAQDPTTCCLDPVSGVLCGALVPMQKM